MGSSQNVKSPPFGLPDSFFAQHLFNTPHCLSRVAESEHNVLTRLQLGYLSSSIQMLLWALCALLCLVPHRAQLSYTVVLFKLSSPIPPSVSLTMADAYLWDSADLPHPFLPNEVTQAFWKEERQGRAGAWGAGVSLPPGSTPCTASGETKQDATASSAEALSSAAEPSRSTATCIGLDRDPSSGDDGTYQVSKPNGQCRSTSWVPSRPEPPPPSDRSCMPPTPPVCPPPGIQPPPAPDADDSLAGFRAVDCPMRLRIDEVFSG